VRWVALLLVGACGGSPGGSVDAGDAGCVVDAGGRDQGASVLADSGCVVDGVTEPPCICSDDCAVSPYDGWGNPRYRPALQ